MVAYREKGAAAVDKVELNSKKNRKDSIVSVASKDKKL